MDWSFVIDEPLMGAVRTTQKQKWVDPRYKRYAAWKKAVRLIANVNGIPSHLDPKKSYRLDVLAYWKAKQRIDGDNLLKALMDSLWKQDRRITSIEYVACEHNGRELARVTLSEEMT